jgi:hypothetical protein
MFYLHNYGPWNVFRSSCKACLRVNGFCGSIHSRNAQWDSSPVILKPCLGTATEDIYLFGKQCVVAL